MIWLKQFFLILLFYAIGTLLSRLIGDLIPGSVLGMFLLFFSLKMGWVKSSAVREVSHFLASIMGLLFIPAGVGLVTQFAVLRSSWHIILVAMVISTILVMGVVGLLQEYFEKGIDKAGNTHR